MMAQFSVGIDTNDPDPNHPLEASRPHPITEAAPAGEPSGPAVGNGSTGTTQPTDAATPAITAPAQTPPTAETPTVQKDVLIITTARHRLNKDMTFTGTSTVTGTVPAGPASATLYDVSPGRAASRLGAATINSLGNWSLTVKPGPVQQVTSVKAESSRGGIATRRVDTR